MQRFTLSLKDYKIITIFSSKYYMNFSDMRAVMLSKIVRYGKTVGHVFYLKSFKSCVIVCGEKGRFFVFKTDYLLITITLLVTQPCPCANF